MKNSSSWLLSLTLILFGESVHAQDLFSPIPVEQEELRVDAEFHLSAATAYEYLHGHPNRFLLQIRFDGFAEHTTPEKVWRLFLVDAKIATVPADFDHSGSFDIPAHSIEITPIALETTTPGLWSEFFPKERFKFATVEFYKEDITGQNELRVKALGIEAENTEKFNEWFYFVQSVSSDFLGYVYHFESPKTYKDHTVHLWGLDAKNGVGFKLDSEGDLKEGWFLQILPINFGFDLGVLKYQKLFAGGEVTLHHKSEKFSAGLTLGGGVRLFIPSKGEGPQINVPHMNTMLEVNW